MTNEIETAQRVPKLSRTAVTHRRPMRSCYVSGPVHRLEWHPYVLEAGHAATHRAVN